MSDQSFFAQHAERLIDNGYSIIPIRPGEKSPGKFISESWHGLPKWQEYCERMPTELEVSKWSEWPGAGIGFPCGNIIAIDIDVEDAAISQRVAELARIRLGDTPAVRIGKAPKQLLVYRCHEPFQSFDAKPLQVLALGRQFVGYGVHPVTGMPYQWPMGSLSEIDKDSLPAVNLTAVRAFMAEAIRLVPESMRPETLRDISTATTAGPKEPATFEAVEEALDHVISDGHTSRKDWIEIGMAIKAGIGEEGRELWHKWSAKDHGRYSAKEADFQWNSLKADRGGNSIGVGTLFEKAMVAGWHPSPGVYLYAHELDAAYAAVNVDIPTLIATMLAKSKIKDDAKHSQEITSKASEILTLEEKSTLKEISTSEQEPIKYVVPQGEPSWLRGLDGGLRMFVDYTRSQSHRDQPLLALAVALPVFGTLAGRRYKGETGLFTNLYTVGIGGSASGKEMGINIATRLFNEANLAHLIGGEEIASGRAIISALEAKPTCFFALDEFGKMLARVTNTRSRSANDADIFKTMLTMFSASQRTYSGVEYANKKERTTNPIHNPCLSIYGPTTGSTFWKALSSGEAVDGSLARMLVFESEHSYPKQRRVYSREIPQPLLDIAKTISDGAEGHDWRNPMGEPMPPRPFIVRMDPDAVGQDDELMDYQDQLLREHEGTSAESIYGRMREIILKVALVRAISSNPAKPIVTKEYFDWSATLVLDSVAHMVKAINLNIADNEHEAYVKRILRMIVESKKRGMTGSEVTRRTQFIDARKREGIIRDLIESGQVLATKTETFGRPMVTYTAI